MAERTSLLHSLDNGKTERRDPPAASKLPSGLPCKKCGFVCHLATTPKILCCWCHLQSLSVFDAHREGRNNCCLCVMDIRWCDEV